jgi:hypothetical protein
MMPETNYCGRQAAFIENSDLRVTVLKEGGHIAEILDKRSGVNPLWIPPWPSIEPSTYDSQKHAAYGTSSDARLLTERAESRCAFDRPILAKSQIEVEYYAVVRNTDSIPDSVDWPQLGKK